MNFVSFRESLNHIEIKIGLVLIDVVAMSYLVYNQANMTLSELFYKMIVIWLINLIFLRIINK
ncbi:hypothetical protein [Vibrio tapetis]|uniref:Uncharacterized protein n=1 Tax=Vibrio tapetis subsp. tapetis TaxID=1671868 RepID=A0A2N8ZKC1_9VIBR|nr:hypothetical protein [Vibrio tapetis]SON52360.1 protein of unknown function [Vibrio tapetis subsp. tapetis]